MSIVFMAVVSAAGVTKPDASAHSYGPILKASSTTTVAKSGGSLVR